MKNKRKNLRNVFWKELFKDHEFIYTLINLAVLTVIIVVSIIINKTFDFSSLVDVGTFTAVILAFILNFISNAVLSARKKKKEDETKLTTDFDELLKIYTLNVKHVKYRNTMRNDRNVKIGRKHTSCSTLKKEDKSDKEDIYKIPIAEVIRLEGKNVVFNDDKYQEMYKHPSKLDGMVRDIFKAHSYSKTYNQLMIRCDGIKEEEDTVNMSFSRTSYFESLVTNRALDYKVNGLSVRDLCAYGPLLAPLEESKLSNHIGYNGFVETQDGKIVLIFRNKYVSISKNTMQSSVGASLKVKYATDANGKLTKDGVVKAMVNEIEDELCLRSLTDYQERKQNIFKDFTFDNVLYFYRELVEGGKPQFMFYSKLPITSTELKAAYTKGVKRSKRGDFYCAVDGFRMLLVDKKELKDIYITPDGMTINGKFYKSVPTSTGTLALLINYLDEKGEI